MNIKGMSIKDIMSMSWKEMKSLNERELKALSQRLNSAANKRLRRIEKSGEANWSPAYQHIKKSGGDFSVKGKGDKISHLYYSRTKHYYFSCIFYSQIYVRFRLCDSKP